MAHSLVLFNVTVEAFKLGLVLFERVHEMVQLRLFYSDLTAWPQSLLPFAIRVVVTFQEWVIGTSHH